jgi:hypothetical protein
MNLASAPSFPTCAKHYRVQVLTETVAKGDYRNVFALPLLAH